MFRRFKPNLVVGTGGNVVLLGGATGLGLAWFFVQQGDPTNGMLPVFMLPNRDVTAGVVMIVAVIKARHYMHFFMNWYMEPRRPAISQSSRAPEPKRVRRQW